MMYIKWNKYNIQNWGYIGNAYMSKNIKYIKYLKLNK